MDLPAPFLAVLPELAGLAFPDEPLASCARCAMAPRAHPEPGAVAFTAPARCCTYQPTLPSWLAGRALRRGGPGAERVRARIDAGDGAHPVGLRPDPALAARWRSRPADAYGRDPTLTCPYWREGEALACAVHPDRNAVCRTWHCRLGAGARAQAAWGALNVVLVELERALADLCERALPPPADGAPGEAWAAWYVACADRVDALGPDDREALRTPRLLGLLDRLRQRVAERDAPMPERPVPQVRDWVVGPDGVWLSSFSPFDRWRGPPWIFELLSRLDGRPWRDAVRDTSAAIGAPVPDDLVWTLWQRGLIGPDERPEPLDPLPG